MRSQRILPMKIASVLSLVALCAALATVAVTRPPVSAHTAAGPHAATGSFRASRGNVTLLGAAQPGHWFSAKASAPAGALTRAEWRMPQSPRGAQPLRTNPDAPVVSQVAGKPAVAEGGGSDPAFNGLGDRDDLNTFGLDTQTPSPSICIGYDPTIGGRPKVLFEVIDVMIGEYSPAGTPVTNGLINTISRSAGGPGGFETSLNTFFGITPAGFGSNLIGGEAHCAYDPDGQFLYFTALHGTFCFSTTGEECTAELLAFNTTSGAAYEYAFDFSDTANTGCPCVPDQPTLGFDSNAICITADQYQGGAGSPGTYAQYYNGSELYCADKLFVQNGFPLTLNATEFFYDNLAMNVSGLGQVPVLGLKPAITESGPNGTDCEWLAEQFPVYGDRQ